AAGHLALDDLAPFEGSHLLVLAGRPLASPDGGTEQQNDSNDHQEMRSSERPHRLLPGASALHPPFAAAERIGSTARAALRHSERSRTRNAAAVGRGICFGRRLFL